MSVYLTREQAMEKLRLLQGHDLRQMADAYGITVFKDDAGFNKGWAGHVIEHYLGLPRNSLQQPDFGDWELKTVSLKRLLLSGRLVPKETMAITMINPADVVKTPFRRSHLYSKLARMIVCGRIFINRSESSTILERCEMFDFDDNEDIEMLRQIEQDYEQVREVLAQYGGSDKSITKLSGKMGILVQPRTKGAGHGSISRAFYMRVPALAKLLKLV